MTQLKFTVSPEAIAYLRWYAKNILLEKTADDAARHLMMKQLEETRRAYRKDDPTPDDLTPSLPSSKEAGDA
jgi:hypothetical protein